MGFKSRSLGSLEKAQKLITKIQIHLEMQGNITAAAQANVNVNE